MQFRLSLLFAFMALFACVLSQPISPPLYERGSFFSSLKSKPSSGIKPYTGPGALDTKGGGGGSGNPNIKAFYPTGNPNPETPLPHSQNSAASRTDAVAGKEDDYFGNWGAFGKHRRSLQYLLSSINYNGEE